MSSRSSQERNEDKFAALPQQEYMLGTFVTMNGPLARVNHGSSTVDVRSVTTAPLVPGAGVKLQRRGGQVVLLGPTSAPSNVGKVTATGSPRATVEYPPGSGKTTQMPYNSAYTPTVNDTVLISWDGNGPSIVCKLTADPSLTPPATSGGAGPQLYHPGLFTAIDSGSFRSGRWWTTDVYSSDGNIGAWFYGSKIRDSIPDGAIIQSARIYLPLQAKNASGSPLLGLHTADTKPAGTVAISSAIAIPAGQDGWYAIPTSFIDVLKASAGGFGFNHGGYTIWNGVASDGQSGALDITYQA